MWAFLCIKTSLSLPSDKFCVLAVKLTQVTQGKRSAEQETVCPAHVHGTAILRVSKSSPSQRYFDSFTQRSETLLPASH